MKAEFQLWNGVAQLVITAENGTDAVALDRWSGEYFRPDKGDAD